MRPFRFFTELLRPSRPLRPFPAVDASRLAGGRVRREVSAQQYLELVAHEADRIVSVKLVQPDIERGTFARFDVELDPVPR